MNNNNTVQVGVGWVKETKDGKQMISCVGGDTKSGLTLILKNSAGEEMVISKFCVFFSDKNDDDPKQAKWPDCRLVAFQE